MNDFQCGDRVIVTQSPTAPEEDVRVIGVPARFLGYSTKGYAQVVTDAGLCPDTWLVHPENLRRVVDCAVEGCGFYANDMSDYCASHG